METLPQTGELNSAFKLLQRLRQRYDTVNDITKAFNPPSTSTSTTDTATVNALFCRYCKRKVHKLPIFLRKSEGPTIGGLKNPVSSSPRSLPAKRQWFLCEICDSTTQLSYQRPRREEARKCLAQSQGSSCSLSSSNKKPTAGWGTIKQGWASMMRFPMAPSHGVIRDEVTY